MPVTVLVVDDDPGFREVARRLLAAAGLEVVGEAPSAATAAAATLALRPDALLIDVWLADDDGVELAVRLAALPWRPRVVLTSAHIEAVDAENLLRTGIAAFVPKQDLPEAPLEHLFAARSR